MMREETLGEVINGIASIGGSLLKDTIINRQRRDARIQQMDKEIELAQAREQARQTQPQAVAPQPGPDSDMPGPNESAADAIDGLMAEEQCSTCRQLLSALKDRPVEDQLRGIMEYGEFKRELSNGADVDQLKEVLRQTTVLKSVFEEDIRGPPV